MSIDRQLGSFEVHEILGWGGMGTVYRGVHKQRGEAMPVAIKILSTRGTREAEFREAFAREVAALAALDHPHVIKIYDHGVVPEGDWPVKSFIVPGSPWLAMELGHHGTLSDFQDRVIWADIRNVLLCLLEALAHAHAHGMIHRDIKPANVLLDGNGGAILTDFGLAHALERADLEEERSAGTPLYMSPEQILGRWRDIGPWTDLYALGVLGWRLATGRPPFARSGEVFSLLDAHVRQEPPAFHPRTAVPVGFESWLRRLLEKDPRRRHRRAADAAWDLRGLGPAVEPEGAQGRQSRFEGGDDASTRVASSGSVFGLFTPINDHTPCSSLTATIAERAPTDVEMPPVPDWRQRSGSRHGPLTLRGAGAALVGLRRLPLVGREDERDALWDAMIEASQHQHPQVVALTGAAGFGKSRLAEWLCKRAHEVGAASALHALHAPVAGPSHGLGAMTGRHFRCVGIGRTEVTERVESLLLQRESDVLPGEARALVELISPRPRDAEGRSYFGRPRERWALLERLLDDLLLERPVVLWLDDVQWGADALGFVQHLLREEAPSRALTVVLTARDDLLPDRPAERALLDELLVRSDVREVPVGPLGEQHRPMLVRGILGLESSLAARVEERTGGNPLFAVQLVQDWVERGTLVAEDGGYKLATGDAGELPDDLHGIWGARLDRVLLTHEAEWGLPLELAATLGQQVDDREWSALCSACGVSAPTELVEALSRQGLAGWRPNDSGWAFAHGMLREAVEERARERGRRTAHHRVCADMLEAGGDADPERLARHLLAAGEMERALGPLRTAIDARAQAAASRIAAALTEEYRRALEWLGCGPDDPRVLWTRLREATSVRAAGDIARAIALASTLIADAESAGHPLLAADARFESGQARWHATQLPEAASDLCLALAAARGVDERRAARFSLALGEIRWRQGRSKEAEPLVEHALGAYETLDDDFGRSRSLMVLATITRQQGRFELSMDYAKRGLEIADRGGFRGTATRIWNVLGEVHRVNHRYDEAARCYRESLTMIRALGSPFGLAPAMNLGLVLAEMHDYAAGRVELDAVLDRATRLGMEGCRISALVSLLLCDAGEKAWHLWEDHMRLAKHLLQATGYLESDCPRSLHIAGQVAVEAGEISLAREAWELALSQWRALDREDAAAWVKADLEGLLASA
jgi:eukaryotic-like serine/threonine-protein kinase